MTFTRLAALGFTLLVATPFAESGRFISAELVKWAKVARDAGIKAE